MKRVILLLMSAAVAAAVLAGCAGRSTEGALLRATPESMGMNSAKLSQVDAIVDSFIADGSIPGAVLSVVRDDRIVYLKAYGNRQVVPDTLAMSTETVFDLASVSKCVGTTLAFMQLVENGKVRLSDDVKMYIPDFAPWTDPDTGGKVDITVRDLLTHTSGIAPYISVPAYVERFGAATPEKLIRYIATEVRRNFRPGTDYMYSCLNFVTLQNILQNVTGERLCDYVRKNVFDVLGLKHTCYLPERETLALCAPTEVQPDGLPLVGQVHDPMARVVNCGNSGNAGVFSSAEDLSVIAAAIMNGGSINGHRILSPLTVETMATVPPENNPAVGRALGWDNCSDSAGLRGDLFSRTRTLCHTGYTGTSMIMDLDSKTAVILLTNRVHPYDEGGCGRLRALVANAVAGSIEKL